MIIKHPYYNSYNLDNDIMLIKLSYPATLNSYVRTVALPVRCTMADEPCLVSGWGNTSANGGKSRRPEVTLAALTGSNKAKAIDRNCPTEVANVIFQLNY